MKKLLKIAGYLLLAAVVVLQFFRPDRNLAGNDPETDLITVYNVPENVAVILENSCYDCHSNRTDYPWYSYISPVSWYLDRHIRDGKEELNMGNFGSLEQRRQIRALNQICEELEEGAMPLKSYLLIHRKARLSEGEIDAVCTWSEEEAMRILSDSQDRF